jgi:hypothetical protein
MKEILREECGCVLKRTSPWSPVTVGERAPDAYYYS